MFRSLGYASPDRLYKIDPQGLVLREQIVEGLAGGRSLDCTDAVRLLRVLADRRLEVVEFEVDSLSESARRPVVAGKGVVAGGLKVLNGEEWRYAPDPSGAALMVRSGGSAAHERLAVQLPRAGRSLGNRSVLTPLFYRQSDGRYVYVQTEDYSIVEFTRSGELKRVWRRSDPHFAIARVTRLPGDFVEDEMVVGCALIPGCGIAVHVTKRRRESGGTYVELLDSDYRVAGECKPRSHPANRLVTTPH